MKRIVILFLTLTVIMSALTLAVCAYNGYSDYEYYDYDEYGEYEYSESGYDESYGEFEVGKSILLSFIVGFVIALIITGVMRSKMKSVRFEKTARNYIKQGSMNVMRSHDMYLYSHVTKTPKPQNDKKR